MHNLSSSLAELDRREDALAASAEAVGIYRELAAARPDAFRPDLTRTLSNLAVRLSALDRREDALATSQEATDTYRDLAAAARTHSGPTWPARCTTWRSCWPAGVGGRMRWPRSKKPSPSAGSWLPGGPMPTATS